MNSSLATSKLAFLSILLGIAPLYGQTQVDSVHYSALDLAGIEEWSLGEPDLVLGGIDGTGPLEFQFVGPIQSLGDSGFALTNWSPPEVRIFNADGTHRTSVGGSGQGPGEFQQLTKLFRLPPDSLATWDASQGRGPVFSDAGSYGRQINRPDSLPRSWVHGVFGDGRLAVATMAGGERTGLRRPTTYTLHLASRDGSIGNEIGQFPGQLMFLSEELGYWTNITFGSSGASAIGRPRAWIVDGSTPRLTGRDPAGTRLSITTWEPRERDISTAQLEAFWESYSSRGGNFAKTVEQRRRLPVADAFPVTGQILIDAEDRVWVQLFPRPLDRSEQWLVFGPDGHLRARVMMPEGFQFREATATHVFGVARDEWDVERVERRAFQPAG